MTKYKRPATDPLFQNQSQSELLLEWYEDLYEELDDLRRTFESGEAQGRTAPLEERFNKICEILGEKKKLGDPLTDWWEREAAAGNKPDLDQELADLPSWWLTQYGDDDG